MLNEHDSSSVRPLRPDERHAAATLLTDALLDDPAFTHIIASRDHRRAAILGVMEAAVALALAEGTAIGIDLPAERGSTLAGVAVWKRPGTYPLDTRAIARTFAGMLPALVRSRGRLAKLARMGHAIDQRFDDDAPVWYLEVLGVVEYARGLGLGQALARWGLQRADHDAIPAHLETGKRDNVGYYQRLGFDLIETSPAIYPGGPPMWFLRTPSPSDLDHR